MKFEYVQGSNALFLGNGLNNLYYKNSWNDLMKKIGSDVNFYDGHKQFTLAFEEIVHKRLPVSDTSDLYNQTLKGIKNTISSECQMIDPRYYHKKLIDLYVSTYLTTNYDYAIEKVFDPNFGTDKNNRQTADYKYSLKRFRKVDDKIVWHLHGELDNGYSGQNKYQYTTASIMIGHEHYGDYYRKIHQYLRPSDNITTSQYSTTETWVSLFFTHDLHIVGFGMDVSEFHLWWLFAYRARLMKRGDVKNRIYYHYPDFSEGKYLSKRKAKNELLKSLGINLLPIKIAKESTNGYLEFWEKFFLSFNEKLELNE